MTPINRVYVSFSALMLFLLVFFYVNQASNQEQQTVQNVPKIVQVERDIPIKQYFEYIDSIVSQYYKYSSGRLTEHVLVRFNP